MVRLRSMTLQPGDLLLMQGPPEAIAEFAADNGCVPLAERELRIPSRRKAWQAGRRDGAVRRRGGLRSAAGRGVLRARRAGLDGAAHGAAAQRSTTPSTGRSIVLLAALIPVAGAMESTGTADLIARLMLEHVAQGQAGRRRWR